MMITKINSFIYIYQRLCKFFTAYYLLEATLNGCIRDFFTINIFALINGEVVYLITIELTVKLNDKETVNGSYF